MFLNFPKEPQGYESTNGGWKIRFASAVEGRSIVSTDDEWVKTTGNLQRSNFMSIEPRVVSEAEFVEHLQSAIQDWTASTSSGWDSALQEIGKTLEDLKLPLPSEVLLVSTDGSDAWSCPYTRGNAVFLPTGCIASPRVLAHELFHVASRQSPEWTDKLFSTIGFRRVNDLQWPLEWDGRQIANPDAPRLEHVVSLELPGGRRGDVMPVLLGDWDHIAVGQSFIGGMQLRLLEVEAQPDGPTLPVRVDGQLQWHEPKDVPDFACTLGMNTDYMIHPEEVMADNVAGLAYGMIMNNPRLSRALERQLVEGVMPTSEDLAQIRQSADTLQLAQQPEARALLEDMDTHDAFKGRKIHEMTRVELEDVLRGLQAARLVDDSMGAAPAHRIA